MVKKKDVVIRGLIVSIETKHEGKQRQIFKRKLVSPEFIQLWFKILDNEFDKELWMKLNQHDKDFLGICIRHAHIYNPDFEKALASDHSKHLERLRLLEESIKAGNLSGTIQKEFNDIIDKLKDSGQITSMHATKLKKRLDRTLKANQK